MLKTLLKIATLFGVGAYLIYALTLLGKSDAPQECTGLAIIINDSQQTGFVTENEVRQLLVSKKIFPEGRPLADIDLVELETALTSSPYIDAALCYTTAEGQLSMQITPRRPVLHVLNDAGEDFYIDNHGATMPRGHHQIDLIVMTGNVPRRKAGPLYSAMGVRLSEDPFWSKRVDAIHVTPQGELQITPRIGQHTIILGDTSRLDDKLSRMRTFYTEGLDKVGWNLYKTISLKYDTQIICTRRD